MMEVVHICNEAIVRQQESNSGQEHGKIDPMVAIFWNRLLKGYRQKTHICLCLFDESFLDYTLCINWKAFIVIVYSTATVGSF